MKRFNLSIAYLCCIYIIGLIFFSIYRIIEFCYLIDLADIHKNTIIHSITPFFKGVWFDNVISCYILALPLLVVLITGICNCYHTIIRKAITIWCTSLYSIAFIISAANIPYFKYFTKNINSSIFEWADYVKTTAGMVFQEFSFLFFFILYFALTALFIFINIKLFKSFGKIIGRIDNQQSRKEVLLKIGVSILLLAICFLGIRGRIGTTPIRTSQAYYCNNTFLNQLGINPAFSFLYSIKEAKQSDLSYFNLMNNQEAIAYAKNIYGTSQSNISPNAPLRRHIKSVGAENKKNIVLIFMESMSASLMQHFGQEKRLTPTLDSLYNHSLMFSNFYSAGVHTNQGVTSVLFSFPALMKRNMMKSSVTHTINGLPSVLQEHGYKNIFFIPHESQYDNMNAFLRTNGINDIYDQSDYPRSEWVNNFGVSDHYLFDFALPVLRKEAASGQPFFASILTVSNHAPIVIPKWFKSKNTNIDDLGAEYADWCIGDFLKKASKEPWYDNTYFVLVGDHGKNVGVLDAELPQSWNHIPLLILGKDIYSRVYDGLGMQVDIMPTLLGLLHLDYQLDGFGIDLLQRRRDKVFYSADNQIVGRTYDKVNIYTPSMKKSFCYDIDPNNKLIPTQNSPEFEELKKYSTAMIQTAQWIFKQN